MGLLQKRTRSEKKPGQRARRPRLPLRLSLLQAAPGGRGGIRTHEALASLPLFESGSFNHSDTLPPRSIAHSATPRNRNNLASAWNHGATALSLRGRVLIQEGKETLEEVVFSVRRAEEVDAMVVAWIEMKLLGL